MSARFGSQLSWRRAAGRLSRHLLMILVGLLALFAFDGVAHAAERDATAPAPAHACATTQGYAGSDAGSDRGDTVLAAHDGGHRATGERGAGDGAAHGALASCALMLTVAITLSFAVWMLLRGRAKPPELGPLRALSPNRWLMRRLGVMTIFELGVLRI